MARGPARSQPGASASAAVLPLAIVTGVIAWWGWKSGAYFDVVFLPGSVLLLGLAVALLLFAPWPGALAGPGRVALWAFFGLSAWTLVSALWSPAPAVAVSDAQRVFMYAVCFGLGVWLCLLLGRRLILGLAPLAAGGGIVAFATLIALWVGDNAAEFFEDDATLRYPLGYRNAEAAFFGIALWPMIVLAASKDLDWRARAALLASATLSIELAILSESRAALFAFLLAAAVLIAVHPLRMRMVGYLALAAAPAALALPWLLDVFAEGNGDTAQTLVPLHTACAAMAVTTAVSLALGAFAALREPGLSPSASRAVGRGLLALVGIALVVGVVSLARADGGPVGFVGDRIDQLTAGTPDLQSEGTRFGLDLRSHRGDLWRVAWDDFGSDPLAGGGAGSFRSGYLLARDEDATDVQPEDPHSVELLMASELGVVGVLLFAAVVIGAVLAALRSRRLGPAAGAAAAGALAAGAYWLVQASVDWFWHYPAITMPVAFASGVAAAPAMRRLGEGGGRSPGKLLLALGALLAAISLLPFFLSERYTNQALRTWQGDLPGAYADLERAADLNPLSERPLAAEAVIADSAGEPQRALAALSEAQQRHPDEWTLYFLEAKTLREIDPAGARRALERARELNPQGTEMNALERRLNGG